MGRAFLAAALGLGLMLGAGAASAQPRSKKDDKAKADEKKGEGEEFAPKVKVERGRGGKKVYRITQGFVIEGRIQKPNAFYVLQRSQINYDWAGLKQKFVPRILDAVRKSPF
jgi:hypothetical protein